MPQVKNTSTTREITLRTKDNQREVLAPGETKTLNIDEKNPKVVGLTHAGVLLVGKQEIAAASKGDKA